MAKTHGFRWFNDFFALCCVAAAAVQFNDPDPLLWILIYLASAAACLTHDRWRHSKWLAMLAFVIGTAWCSSIAVQIDRVVTPGELVGAMEMKGGAVELTREAMGLGLTSAWMVFLLWRSRREAGE